MFELLQAAATTDPATFLGSTPAGWITNAIVVGLVLFIRHLYEDRIDELKLSLERLDDRDQVRGDTLDRTIRTVEQQGELGKSQNAMIKDMYEKNAELIANMRGRMDESDRRAREPRR